MGSNQSVYRWSGPGLYPKGLCPRLSRAETRQTVDRRQVEGYLTEPLPSQLLCHPRPPCVARQDAGWLVQLSQVRTFMGSSSFPIKWGLIGITLKKRQTKPEFRNHKDSNCPFPVTGNSYVSHLELIIPASYQGDISELTLRILQGGTSGFPACTCCSRTGRWSWFIHWNWEGGTRTGRILYFTFKRGCCNGKVNWTEMKYF